MDITIQRVDESPFCAPDGVGARFVFHGATEVEPGGLGRFHDEAEAAMRAYPDLISHVDTLSVAVNPVHDETAVTVLLPIPINILNDEPAHGMWHDDVVREVARSACYALQYL